ncbi:MAG: HPr kinase, partial [Flavipsychrobacter sp.]|nr:HPr kinase [Flavipsychrobacter sp.]
VTAGKDVIIEPFEGRHGREIRIFLLATVMAVVLLQRKVMPLHASGIVKDDRLILFTGDSGAGKSTSLAYLVSKGYRIFTDDICILKADPENDKHVLGVASYPMLKLWDDAVSKLRQDAYRDKTFKVNNDLDKYGYFFYDTFLKEPFIIGRIFILKKSEAVDKVAYRTLSGIEAFGELEKQTYRKYLIADPELKVLHFRIMSLLTSSTTVYEVIRPVNCNIEDLAGTLESLF